MARIKDIVFDCDHPASLARFWAFFVKERSPATGRFVTMTDPEGNEFCVMERSV